MRNLASLQHLRHFLARFDINGMPLAMKLLQPEQKGLVPDHSESHKERNHGNDGNPKSSLHARINRAEAVDLRSLERCFRVPRPVVWTRLRRNIPLFPWPGPRYDVDCRQPWRLVVSQKPDGIQDEEDELRRRRRHAADREFAVTVGGSRLDEKPPARPRYQPLVPLCGKALRQFAVSTFRFVCSSFSNRKLRWNLLSYWRSFWLQLQRPVGSCMSVTGLRFRTSSVCDTACLG